MPPFIDIVCCSCHNAEQSRRWTGLKALAKMPSGGQQSVRSSGTMSAVRAGQTMRTAITGTSSGAPKGIARGTRGTSRSVASTRGAGGTRASVLVANSAATISVTVHAYEKVSIELCKDNTCGPHTRICGIHQTRVVRSSDSFPTTSAVVAGGVPCEPTISVRVNSGISLVG